MSEEAKADAKSTAKKSFDVEILSETENTLLNRTEMRFRIEHKFQPVPDRYSIKEKIAALKTADEELVFVKKVDQKFGTPILEGDAAIYTDKEAALRIEQKYMQIRNLPPDERKEARKQWKAMKKKKKQKGIL